jgi:hypothetical protein
MYPYIVTREARPIGKPSSRLALDFSLHGTNTVHHHPATRFAVTTCLQLNALSSIKLSILDHYGYVCST